MTADPHKQQLRRTMRRDLWLTLTPAVLLMGAAFAAAFHFIEPAPPKKLVLAMSPDEGGFRFYARKYQDFLARHGVTLELRSTKGSIDNIALLADARSGVDVAFVQSGTVASEKAAENVVSLGSLSYVPLWVFHRGEPLEDVRQLEGRRIAVGPEGSGTRALALTLLKANAVEGAPTELLPLERDAAVEQLKQGQLDAVFLISPAESPIIHKLAAVPGIQLLSFSRAEAYSRRFTYLSRLVLPRGVFNLAADIPERDVEVLAPTANLVARDSLHPALAYLLMRAASEVHGKAGLLDGAGEFPAPRETGFPLSSEARRYYEAGVPLLQRYLPFWAANLVDRLWVMLVPFIAVVVPLFRIIPALYQWRIRSRIVRWYARLKEIEIQLDENPGREMLEDMLKRLEEAEREVNRIPMPLSYAENLYFFREHIEVVRRRLIRRLAGGLEGVDGHLQHASAQ
ncbi:TRAP transporter solute receptor TAXI family protein [Myxococcus stipitatus DSM 14675]|uniref:TRAP transporter solute receptor TAXI family protein n=1 Tax=Myxococcus stipitatus (strain DSM 14675 / JCM 12634 / Mx s8) TaxID=1278073 RepID=L7U530_MYXSD|nr:TAXI family TRAP transporter solute-binding subunit [Myxococcus stipitatus]AGC43936.1 TRAP transporter solute receptor TAXI family protein [Myxococcus stipitatus DSM 14675]